MTPSLIGQTVSSVTYVGGLYVDTDEGWQITVESDFRITESAGRTLSKSDGDLSEILALLVEHVGDPIVSFDISETGQLEFTVGSVRVHAAPSPNYEAWNVAGPDKQLVVCMPGGELAIWS